MRRQGILAGLLFVGCATVAEPPPPAPAGVRVPLSPAGSYFWNPYAPTEESKTCPQEPAKHQACLYARTQ